MKRITVLTGAGFTASKHFADITTKKLTDKIRKTNVSDQKLESLFPGEFFYRKLCHHYLNNNNQNEAPLDVVNFETIMHSLEEIYSYYTSQNPKEKKKASSYEFKGIKPSLFYVKQKIQPKIREASSNLQVDRYTFIRRIYTYFIQYIIDTIESFNKDEGNNGMNEFKNEFLHNKLGNSFIKRFYSLNYDNWLNIHANYFDGFDENGQFIPDKVLKDRNSDCHYNLHGCARWKPSTHKGNYIKLKRRPDLLGIAKSSNHTNSREPLIPSPIITGYNKIERQNLSPFLEFTYSFQRDIIESDIILIIGYAFSDNHINNILQFSKGKVIIVNLMTSTALDTDNTHKLCPFSEEVSNFTTTVNHIFEEDFPDGEDLRTNSWFSSNNKKIRVWWKGVGRDFYRNWSEIIQ